ncbi:MAG: hypothetical protein CMJ81_17635 [Planctomycetaceae bacterium]|nr:hypothetical protein [Planctomycetaceae bacterium]MBP62858.1 hypothetical protein [Planctomycetaceae bacterium]
MSEILFHYQEIHPTTWAYVSSLIIIGLFFKFNRFWSVRNLDLIFLILLAPGLLLIHFGVVARKAAIQQATRETESVEVGLSDPVEISIETDPSTETEENGPPDKVSVLESATPSAGEEQVKEKGTGGALGTNDNVEEKSFGESLGYIWLFAVGGSFLFRLLIDPVMVRRPLLDPNLTLGGLTFVCCALFAFLMANVIAGEPTEDDLKGAQRADLLMARQEAPENDSSLHLHGPGFPLLYVLPTIPTVLVHSDDGGAESRYVAVAKLMAILSQFFIVAGIIFIGCRHFDNIRSGMGAAVLYLLLPYTALMTGRVDHILPAALLIWAVVFYRRPVIAGVFLGLAMGVVYYPFFLLPLWLSFYWHRGLLSLIAGVIFSLVLVILSLALTSSDVHHFFEQFRLMFGLWIPGMEGLEGFWDSLDRPYRVYRIPVLAAFIAISAAMALWPAQKNLGTLISCSATVMLAAQFWHGFGGGLYMAWYLPLLLLTIFRPNLEDRIAVAVLAARTK